MPSAQSFEMHMKTTALIHLLQIAGVAHLGFLCAGLMMPRAVQLRSNVATLPPFIRQLFWVYYGFIGFCLLSFGTLTYVMASTLANGTPLSRVVCLFLAAFWTLRLLAATFVFDLKPYLTSASRRLGYSMLNTAFILLPVVYLLAAWKGGKL